MNKPDNLTDKEWAFCLEYPKDWNGTQAAIRAGYSSNSAAEIAYENLRKPHIKAALKSVYEELAMSTEELFARLKYEATENPDAADRLRALGMIGKGHAAFTDKVEQDTTLRIVIDEVEENET